MNDLVEFEIKTKQLIDELKSVCANAGLGNDGNEYKVITQVFLYKFLNDKFLYEVKKNKKFKNSSDIEKDLSNLGKDEYDMLLLELNENTARFKLNNLIKNLFEKQNENNFHKILDDNFYELSKNNNEIFSIITSGGQKILIFEKISQYITDNKDNFCKAIINKLINFSFENLFDKGFDFFATIFEYLIKDYNSDSGGKYAEYFTPHAVSKIMSSCLVDTKVNDASCYDPSAGSGTLLINLANKIGEEKCSIFSQDISQKSSQLLRLNLIINNLTHSLPNIIQGNTILNPFHSTDDNENNKFDFIVSNPPFKTDFSGYRDELLAKKNSKRFFAGVPAVPNKKKDKMPIYLMFIQHIIYALSSKGKASIVVPTGFLSAKGNIEKQIKKEILEKKILSGVISMPGNIFARTNTNVSIIFLDKEKLNNQIFLIDASQLGTAMMDGDREKIVLSKAEEEKVIFTYREKKIEHDFSVSVDIKKIIERNYSLTVGQYFDIKIDHKIMSVNEFNSKIKETEDVIDKVFEETEKLKMELKSKLKTLKKSDT
jgi:type I restriction enzyme M protein